MPDEEKYWDKFWERRVSRRRLLSTTALVGTGLGAAAVVGCSSESSNGSETPGASVRVGSTFACVLRCTRNSYAGSLRTTV